MIQLTIDALVLLNTSSEDGRKVPKPVGGLPHVCISLYPNTEQLLLYIWGFVLLHGTGVSLKDGYYA
jgi:hypothetical protein